MNPIRSLIGRRRFLSISCIAVTSPWLTEVFQTFSPGGIALAAEKSNGPPPDPIINKDWLNFTKEKVIEPDLPICDTHHHLWPDNYLLKDFLDDIGGGHNVIQTVYVESWGRNQQDGMKKLTSVEEVEFAVAESSSIKSRTDVAAAIVGYADLMEGNKVAPLLESQIAAGKNRFRGIRLGRESVISDKKFREGFSNLRKYGLTVDAWMHFDNLMDLVSLGQAFPDTSIIINHCGAQSGISSHDEKSEEVIEKWKAGIKELASCQNIFMKLGGLGTGNLGFDWPKRTAPPGSAELAKEIAPYLSYCIEQFGTGRCMFESNFPPDKEAYSYTILWNAFKRFTKDFSDAERRALFYENAMKVYRLPSASKIT